jgi:alpha-amylase
MKSIILFFQIHQSFQLKKYRFLDIGNDSYYYDDFENERKIRLAADFYLPANELLTGLLQKYKDRFKIAFSISGTAIDQFYLYAPEVLESFQRMAYTGGVEFLGETYSYSLASLFDKDEFIRQSLSHAEKIRDLFNQTPSVYKNTELIYSDYIGEIVARMGFKSILTDVLSWSSPNYLYHHPQNNELKIFINNARLIEDLIFRFNSDHLGAGISNFISVVKNIPQEEKFVNLTVNYESAGEKQHKRSGILNFLKSLTSVLEMTDFNFINP